MIRKMANDNGYYNDVLDNLKYRLTEYEGKWCKAISDPSGRDYYEYLRQEEDRARKARLGEVRHRIPGMKEVLAAEASLNNKLLSMQPGESKDKRQQLREQRKNLEEEKRSLLIQNGYPEDYLERQYKCNICKDTGYTDDGRTCTCCKERAEEAYKWFQKTRKQ